MRIPLPKMMRHWREREFERHLSPATVRSGLALLGFLRDAAAALSPVATVARDRRARRRGSRGRFRGCRSPPAGRGTATSRRRRATPSRRCGSSGATAMSARDIFAKIRRSLGVTGEEAPRRAACGAARRAPRNLVPARGQVPAERVALFRRMVEEAAGTVAEILPTPPRCRRRSPLPAPPEPAVRVRRGDDPRLPGCPGQASARSRSPPAPRTAISSLSRTPSAASPRPARWSWPRAPTIRPR